MCIILNYQNQNPLVYIKCEVGTVQILHFLLEFGWGKLMDKNTNKKDQGCSGKLQAAYQHFNVSLTINV